MTKENYRQRLEQLKRMTKKTQEKSPAARNKSLENLIEELGEENKKLKALSIEQKKIIDKLRSQIKDAMSILQQ